MIVLSCNVRGGDKGAEESKVESISCNTVLTGGVVVEKGTCTCCGNVGWLAPALMGTDVGLEQVTTAALTA